MGRGHSHVQGGWVDGQGQLRVRALEQAWAWPLLSSPLGLVDTAGGGGGSAVWPRR